ncbi:hypothetical protein C1H46_029439 [Malus baccata]|uniref:Uncharacterized protein n=1 Tax=Malus baccata TaxID=106549 RepID=A0A540LEU8_MALBA|nr:hypothetical protein C1H46_029439 [Malus baccata]
MEDPNLLKPLTPAPFPNPNLVDQWISASKINETEVGGRFRPLSEITEVCQRCKEHIEWKRRYGKYKTLTEPAKCQRCTKRTVRQSHHKLCAACAKEQRVCAKCCCCIEQIVGKDLAEVESKQK